MTTVTNSNLIFNSAMTTWSRHSTVRWYNGVDWAEYTLRADYAQWIKTTSRHYRPSVEEWSRTWLQDE